MSRVVIVDDEQEARRSLAVLLAREPNMVLVGECPSAGEALSMLQSATPGLVFLDIDMPECDGFAWLERVGPAPAFAVAFVTVHHQFALRAFDVGALDYILKPFVDVRFARAGARGSGGRRLLACSAFWSSMAAHICADGEYEVEPADGMRLRMSRRYRKTVLWSNNNRHKTIMLTQDLEADMLPCTSAFGQKLTLTKGFCLSFLKNFQ